MYENLPNELLLTTPPTDPDHDSKASLLSGGVTLLAIQIINRVVMLALAVLLARGLGANDYGVYAFAFAVVGLVSVFAEFGFPTLLERLVASADSKQDQPLLAGLQRRSSQLVAGTSLLAAAGLVGFAQVGYDGWQSAQGRALIVAAFILPIGALLRSWSGILCGYRQVVRSRAVEFLVRPISALGLLLIAFTWFPDRLNSATALMLQWLGAALAAGALLMMLRRQPRSQRTSPMRFETKQWLSSAFPLVIVGSAGSIIALCDILMLGFFRSASEVGVYRVAAQSSLLVGMGLQASNMMLAPRFARWWELGEMQQMQAVVTSATRLVFALALAGCVMLALVGQPLVEFVFGSQYVASYVPLMILCVGQLLNVGFGSVGYLLNMTGNERANARGMLAAALANIVLNLLLVPRWGMQGAAVATAISLAFWNLLLHRSVRKLTGLRPSVVKL